MGCVSPPEPGDKELLEYIDGGADPKVLAHLEQCPNCQERARRLAHTQERLIARLYRVMCPPSIELGEYHLGLVTGSQAAAIAAHLAECSHCQREVAQLADYMAGLAPELEPGVVERVKEQVRVVIARLVGPSEQAALTPTFAGVRGEQDELLVYEADGVQIVIQAQESAGQQDRKAILGLIFGIEEPGTLQAELWRAEERTAQVAVDELGNFTVPDLLPGPYELILAGEGLEIHIQGLAL